MTTMREAAAAAVTDKTAMPENRKHLDYIDRLRLMAAFCVVFMHTAAEPIRLGFGADWELLNVCTSFSFTAVPLFFMISGYLLMSGSSTADISVLLKKRLPRLVVPLVLWSAAAILWIMYAQGDMRLRSFLSLSVHALSGPAFVHLWFMYALIAMYAISPVLYAALHSLSRTGHIYVLSLIGLVLLRSAASLLAPEPFDRLFDIDLINRLSLFGGHLCPFLLGYYLGSMKKRIPGRVLVCASVLLLAFISVGTHILSHRSGEYIATLQSQNGFFEIALAACLFLIFRQYADKPLRLRAAASAVPLLFPLYLMHNILLDIVIHRFSAPTGFAGTLGLSAIIFVLSLLILKTAASLRPLCYAATGLSYREASASCSWVYSFKRLRQRDK